MSLPSSDATRISSLLDKIKTDSSLNALSWPYAISAIAGLVSIPSQNLMLQTIFGYSFAAFTAAIIVAFFYSLIKKPEHLRSEQHQYNMQYLTVMGDERANSDRVVMGPMTANTNVEQIERKS